MQEKRDFARMLLEGGVSIETLGDQRRKFTAYLDNVSFGGFSMITNEKTDENTLLDFELMPRLASQAIGGRGKVKYVSAPEKHTTPLYTIGVEFVDVNRDLIAYLLKRIELQNAQEVRNKKRHDKRLDFLPY